MVGDYGTVTQTFAEDRTRLLVLPVAIACGIFLCYQAARLWLADHRIHSSKLEVIERGAVLEPGNAEAWDILGRHWQLDFANADPVQALASHQRAIQDSGRATRQLRSSSDPFPPGAPHKVERAIIPGMEDPSSESKHLCSRPRFSNNASTSASVNRLTCSAGFSVPEMGPRTSA